MNDQEDISKEHTKRSECIETAFQNVAPLAIDKPEGSSTGLQSVSQRVSLDFFMSVLPSIRDYISGYISLADAKAGVLIGVYSGLLSLSVLKEIRNLQPPIGHWGSLEYLTVGSWMLLLVALVLLALVVWPRTITSRKQGFISWPHISNYNSIDDYLKNILSTNDNEIVAQICVLNYDLSKICKRKYLFLTWAFRIGVVGAIVLLFLLMRTLK